MVVGRVQRSQVAFDDAQGVEGGVRDGELQLHKVCPPPHPHVLVVLGIVDHAIAAANILVVVTLSRRREREGEKERERTSWKVDACK